MNRFSRGAYALSLCLLVVLAGCNRVDPLAFNQTISNSNKKLNAAGTKLGLVLTEAMSDKPGSSEKLQAEYTSLQKTLSEVKTEVATLKVPDDATSKALYAAYQKYLEGQESMTTHEIDQMVKCTTDKSLSAVEKANRLQPLVKAIEQKEASDLSVLQEAQKTFASDHHLALHE